MVYQLWLAYALWFFGGLGVLGLHRFYLRKVPTGILWFFSGGLGFLGALYDFFTLPRQVLDANRREGFRRGQALEVHLTRDKEPLERAILRLAERNRGRVSAVQVAASSDWTVDQAQKHLDTMARQGLCELRVLKSGGMVYLFSDFDPLANQDFEV